MKGSLTRRDSGTIYVNARNCSRIQWNIATVEGPTAQHPRSGNVYAVMISEMISNIFKEGMWFKALTPYLLIITDNVPWSSKLATAVLTCTFVLGNIVRLCVDPISDWCSDVLIVNCFFTFFRCDNVLLDPSLTCHGVDFKDPISVGNMLTLNGVTRALVGREI